MATKIGSTGFTTASGDLITTRYPKISPFPDLYRIGADNTYTLPDSVLKSRRIIINIAYATPPASSWLCLQLGSDTQMGDFRGTQIHNGGTSNYDYYIKTTTMFPLIYPTNFGGNVQFHGNIYINRAAADDYNYGAQYYTVKWELAGIQTPTMSASYLESGIVTGVLRSFLSRICIRSVSANGTIPVDTGYYRITHY